MFLFCFCSGDWFHKRSFCLQTGLCAWSRAAVKMPLASLGLPVFDVSQSKCQAHSQPFDPMMSYDLLCFFIFFCEKVVVMRCNTSLVLQQLETGRPLPTLAAWAQAEAGDLSIRFPTWDVRISISARLAQDASLALAQHLSSPGLERLWVSEIQIFSFLRRFDGKAQITRNSFVIQNWPQIHHGSCVFLSMVKAISTCLSTTSLALSLWSAACIVTGHEGLRGLRVHIGRGSWNPGKRNALNVCRLKYGIVLCTSCLRIFEDHWQHCNTSATICIPDSLAPRLELVSSLFILYSGAGIWWRMKSRRPLHLANEWFCNLLKEWKSYLDFLLDVLGIIKFTAV